MSRPEERLQIRCAMFCTSHVAPPTFWTAVEHGRAHKGTAEQRAREWQRMARAGVKKGLADLWFLAPSYVLLVELKTPSNKQTEAQCAFQAKMAVLGHGYEVVRSVEQLGETLVQHGIPLAAGWRVAAMHHDAALDGEAPARKKPARKLQQKPTRTQIAAGNRVALAMARGGE
jgi:hypothetical protein